jgi:SAM-dependent methyltransferase
VNTDNENDAFWSELSGTRAASKLGIAPSDPDSHVVFDRWFFWYYPYLANTSIIPWPNLRDKRVLEVGLGYGSVGRRAIQHGANHTGLDVSQGPIDFLSKTTQQSTATFIKESVLAMPFSDNTFDYVISIGCLHHTGDLPKALNECIRVLQPGGTVVLMVCNALSYKRWITRPLETFRRKRQICTGKKTPERVGKDAWWYDRNMDGAAAPSTVFTTKSEMRELLTNTSIQSIEIENLDNFQDLLPPRLQIRALDRVRIASLRLPFIRRIGLDMYAVATKL